MPTSIIIVDDFLDDPDPLRAAALRLTYPDQQGAFPGRNSIERINIEGLDQFASDLVGEPLEASGSPLSHAKCRITLAKDIGRAHVHIDSSHWSGILYLSRPQDCRGGTEFFRHKATNSERAPRDQAELEAMGFMDVAQMHREVIERDSKNPDAWDQVMTAPMRYNRLVMLRPWLWHTAGPGFGDSIENGRLVYLMFFKLAR
ncbi:hypothetical protein CVO77_17925 [Sphingopyxis lindanitolerans]|uniref:Phytanoyl-CoA dioxygenase n=1 Tax=Sphingopyxis lindanitolerans TaxID=2054227 RepID=A0A2S8B3G7_9SPHN|nr:DUF6445 family protein [Sphingopyxis lindanitolerans]PQM26858.1 hypothetical protein CVO77_17925 [Sphingopyxis lindanitolerans]